MYCFYVPGTGLSTLYGLCHLILLEPYDVDTAITLFLLIDVGTAVWRS